MKAKLYLLLILLGVMTLQSCDNDDNTIALPAGVEAYIQKIYPNATITDVDVLPGGGTEVDIWDGSIEKELKFDMKGEWLSASWDVLPATLPTAITEALKASTDYNAYRIDDADYYETPAGNYYMLELEKNGSPDLYVKMDKEGNFLK